MTPDTKSLLTLCRATGTLISTGCVTWTAGKGSVTAMCWWRLQGCVYTWWNKGHLEELCKHIPRSHWHVYMVLQFWLYSWDWLQPGNYEWIWVNYISEEMSLLLDFLPTINQNSLMNKKYFENNGPDEFFPFRSWRPSNSSKQNLWCLLKISDNKWMFCDVLYQIILFGTLICHQSIT